MEDVIYVPIEEVAKRLTVSVSTIRTWLRQGHIPKSTYIKVGTTYRFDKEGLVKALIAQPDDEVKQQPRIIAPEVISEPVQLELNFNPDQDL